MVRFASVVDDLPPILEATLEMSIVNHQLPCSWIAPLPPCPVLFLWQVQRWPLPCDLSGGLREVVPESYWLLVCPSRTCCASCSRLHILLPRHCSYLPMGSDRDDELSCCIHHVGISPEPAPVGSK